MDIDPFNIIILMVGLGFFMYLVVIPAWIELVTEIGAFFKAIFILITPNMNNLWIYLLIMLLISPFLYWRIFKKLQKRKERREELDEKEAEIEEILDTDTEDYDSTELKEFIEKLRELEFSGYSKNYNKDIEEKIEELEEHLKEVEREEFISERESKAKETEERLRVMNEEIKRKKREMEQDKFKVLLSLSPEENPVYKKDSLTNKEIKILIEEGYSHHNEFCVYEQKRIPVLIKPVMGHSPAHTFLVWSAKRLLKKINGVGYIEESLTKVADITFMYEHEEYALEIETGSLLGKPRQLNEKLNYLNRKFPDRWMFIISHRDLLPKYKELGLTATRNNVHEKLEKLLKIAHP